MTTVMRNFVRSIVPKTVSQYGAKGTVFFPVKVDGSFIHSFKSKKGVILFSASRIKKKYKLYFDFFRFAD